jgi:hypothetical protein
MSTIRLILNVDIWRISININPLGNSIMSIIIAENNILSPASIISGSQISYIVN